MYSEARNAEFIERVKSCEKYKEDYKRLMELALEGGVVYDGKMVPFTYQPLLISEKDNDAFKYIVTRTNEIIRKVVAKYLEDEEFRKLFGFSKELEALILHDPGYEIPVPIGRYDVFYNNIVDFKFCEINTDGSSAMSEDSGLASIFKESEIFKDLELDGWNFRNYELYDSWVVKSLEIYERAKGKKDKINVAIVDFKDSGTPTDFEIFKNSYIDHGANCIIANIEELVYDENKNKLILGDYEIDMVYRRAVTSEIIEKIDMVEDFIKAYYNDAFISIGSFRSQIAHNKRFFKVLHHDTADFLDGEDRLFIENHVPYTDLFDGDEMKLSEIKNDRNRYIFKPNDLRGGHGVYVGSELSDDEFDEMAKKCYNNDYIFQEYVDKKLIDFVELKDDEWVDVKRANMIGLFSYNEAFKGVYARFGVDNIIGSIREYICAPAFRYE